jgi:RNA polymerase sigma-70 factor (ECF subfamily)
VPAPSFASLYAEQAARVRRALILSGATAEVAEDVAQEAFARTYARWRRVSGGTNPAGYVFRVAFRELRRRGHLPDEPDGDATATATPADGHGPDEQALASVAADAARLAIGSMPPRRRACALLVLAAGLTAEEAADALGIAASTVRVHVHRARAQLVALPALAPPPELTGEADRERHPSPVSSEGVAVPLA